jgi:hypothetical protein
MTATFDQHQLARAALELGRRFGIGGLAWVVTRPNASGATITIATVGPLYVLQEQPSRLERVLAQSAAAVRTRWSCVARSDAVTPLSVGDTLTSAADSSLAFLVSGLDRIETPGLCQGTLEKQVFT